LFESKKLRRTVLQIVVVIIIMIMTSTVSYAAGDAFTKGEQLIKDVYAWFLKASTAAAGVGVGTGAFMKKFSRGKQQMAELGGKVQKDSIISWAALNGLGLIITTITPYIS